MMKFRCETSIGYESRKCTLIKKKIKFSSYIKKIQSGAVAKSYMRKGFLIYKEMRKYFPIYEEAFSHIQVWLCNCSILNFLIWFSFLSVYASCPLSRVAFWEGHKSTLFKHKHMLFPTACTYPLTCITEDLLGRWPLRYMRMDGP